MRPDPRQSGHGCSIEKKPWFTLTGPSPPHCGHVIGLVPGAAPVP
jgi:hypothetical protein